MTSSNLATFRYSKRPAASRRELSCFFEKISIVVSFVICLILISSATVFAQDQRSFSSPLQAVDALLLAVQNGNETELLALFGPGAEQLISSGDEVADQRGRAHFLKVCKQKMTLEIVNEDQQTLILGEREYPFPIPIVRQSHGWIFDTARGLEELLNRRVGRNELRTIKVMQVYTDAQREYASLTQDGGVPVFAQRLASSDGAKDGLYWPVAEGEPASPLGPLLAKAAAKGYHADEEDGFADPFYGYYYKVLTAQGESANGGAFDYVVDGKMILGFALVAYPAKYGASGVMTFMVNQEGVVYEKDLGEDTASIAPQITLFDPDSSWHPSQEPSESERK